MSNFTQAFGYKTLIVPILPTAVTLPLPAIGVATSGSPFINPAALDADVIAATATISETGSDSTYALTVASGAYSLAGSGDPFRLFSLKTAALKTGTDSTSVITYDSENLGFDQSVPTSKSWSVDLAGVASFADAGYRMLRILEKRAVSEGLMAKFARVGPVGSTECVYGYGRFTNYSESNDSGNVVEWTCTFEGYGPYGLNLQAPA
jgi:hypothetical protein